MMLSWRQWPSLKMLRAGTDSLLGKQGKFRGPRAFEGLALGSQNTPLLAFLFQLLGCSSHVKIVELFDYCV